MFVAEDLNLDVARFLDVFFNYHVVIFKTFHRLILCRLKLLHELALIANNSHSFATAPEGSF